MLHYTHIKCIDTINIGTFGFLELVVTLLLRNKANESLTASSATHLKLFGFCEIILKTAKICRRCSWSTVNVALQPSRTVHVIPAITWRRSVDYAVSD